MKSKKLVINLFIYFYRIIESEYALYVKQKTNEMLGYLNVVEDKQFKTWCATVPGICKTHLAKNLIYRDPPFVRNNFSPEVIILELYHSLKETGPYKDCL